MMNEDAAHLLPKVSVTKRIVYKDIAGYCMVPLVTRHACDDLCAREMPGSPSHFLWLCPAPTGASGQDDGIEMAHRFEQPLSVWQKRKGRIEIGLLGQSRPKGGKARALFEAPRMHTQNLLCAAIEISQNTIAIEEKLAHGQDAGVRPIVMGLSKGSHPNRLNTSLLSLGSRPCPRSIDQVM